MYTLADDDVASSGGYPDTGFWPTGSAPYTTGAISGWVRTPAGAAATGVRVWAYPVSAPATPRYETFTVSQFEFNPAENAGDYLMKGVLPGEYYVCILPWSNGAPAANIDDPARYNLTTNNGANNTGFPTECFDDAQFSTAAPSFASGTDLLRKVTVTAGATTPGINFVTGAQATDFMLVMDRSGSMGGDSGTPGITKMVALQNAANAFIDYLDLAGGHRLGLVQFDEGTPALTPVFDLQALNSGTVGDAHDAIDFMTPGGWTNIIGGVDRGVSQLSTIGTPADRQIMLVFSDGKHNRPVGSDLNDIDALVSSNDVTLYSVGFGDDVDDAILSQVAVNNGGVHVNETDLDAMALGKHFLSIAASAADQTTLIDPRYHLAPGESASLDVPVLASERDLVLAVQWNTPGQRRFDVQ
ncbi:MAG: vWA domain-containing protein, partial [Myxococcota bacterium]